MSCTNTQEVATATTSAGSRTAVVVAVATPSFIGAAPKSSRGHALAAFANIF